MTIAGYFHGFTFKIVPSHQKNAAISVTQRRKIRLEETKSECHQPWDLKALAADTQNIPCLLVWRHLSPFQSEHRWTGSF